MRLLLKPTKRKIFLSFVLIFITFLIGMWNPHDSTRLVFIFFPFAFMYLVGLLNPCTVYDDVMSCLLSTASIEGIGFLLSGLAYYLLACTIEYLRSSRH